MSYPRETKEFIPITITVDGVSVIAAVQFSITSGRVRPTVWMASVTLGGKIGFMIDAMLPGTYRVHAKVTSAPEVPVIDCGSFTID